MVVSIWFIVTTNGKKMEDRCTSGKCEANVGVASKGFGGYPLLQNLSLLSLKASSSHT
jgi:hypothetical protein